jgi:hypothetical protein
MTEPMPDVLEVQVPTTEAEATEVVRWMETHIGTGFHLDTSGANYVEWDNADRGVTWPLFTEAQAEHYDALRAAIFGLLDDPYRVSITIFEELHPDLLEEG